MMTDEDHREDRYQQQRRDPCHNCCSPSAPGSPLGRPSTIIAHVPVPPLDGSRRFHPAT